MISLLEWKNGKWTCDNDMRAGFHAATFGPTNLKPAILYMICHAVLRQQAGFSILPWSSSFTSHLNLFLRVEVQMKTLGEKCFPESTAVLRLPRCVKQRFVHKEFAARVGWGIGRMNRWSQYNTVTADVRSGQEEKLEEESLTVQQDLRKVPGRDCTGQKACF